MEKLFRFPMNLQLFAGGLIDFEDDGESADLSDADYGDDQTGPEYGDNIENDKPYEGEDEEGDDGEPQDPQEDPEPEADPQPEPEPEKKVQTPEENARFAEQRRQAQLQAEIQRVRESDPAFQLAQQLADMYQTTPEAMLEQVRYAQLQRQAQQTGVPIEYLQQQQAQDQQLQTLQHQLDTLEFQAWEKRIENEQAAMMQAYPFLSEDDLIDAQNHMLQVMRNPDAQLEDAVFALHGKKITAAIREQARQEALAEMSGRKGGPIVPKGNRSNDAQILSAEERAMAKNMGISETDYIKYKV